MQRSVLSDGELHGNTLVTHAHRHISPPTKERTSRSSGRVHPGPVQNNSNTILLPRIFFTDLGWIGFQGSERGMTSLVFGHACREEVERILPAPSDCSDDPEAGPNQRQVAAARPFSQPTWMDAAEEQLIAYAAGEPVDLTAIPCDLPEGTRFEERVREQLFKIGYGQTITYGQLAEAARAPRAARAVGSVMARNPIPLVIPCHRVVAASGKLGGYSAAAGLTMKERLLHLEQTGPGNNHCSFPSGQAGKKVK